MTAAIRLYAEKLVQAEARIRAFDSLNYTADPNKRLRRDVDRKLAQEALNRAYSDYTDALRRTPIDEIEAALAEPSPPPDTGG